MGATTAAWPYPLTSYPGVEQVPSEGLGIDNYERYGPQGVALCGWMAIEDKSRVGSIGTQAALRSE